MIRNRAWRRSRAMLLGLVFLLSGCSGGGMASSQQPGNASAVTEEAQGGETAIALAGSTVSVNGAGASVDGGVVAIHSAGTYRISGTLENGQLRVEAGDDDTVTLLLDGAAIHCETSAPLYVVNADKTLITLVSGTENTLTDGARYQYENTEENEPNAALFSKDDLEIGGSGSLVVEGNCNNGIQCKDDLVLASGTISVTAVHNGIKGKDSITVQDADVTVEAGGDGMKSDNTADADRGWISVEGGVLQITAGEDGIQAETVLTVSGGELTVLSGGGSANSSTDAGWGDWGPAGASAEEDTESAKGLKAGSALTITGGTISIDSSDDSLHTNGTGTIEGGTITISSGDDGFHADETLEIRDGSITVEKSYEGLEGAKVILGGGEISIVSSDDGINAAGGSDGSSLNGRPGENMFTATGDYGIEISGGTVVIDSGGDGLDSNGAIAMTGGTVLVHGPTADQDGAIDYESTFTADGGLLLAAGSAGMAMATSSGSAQNAVLITFAEQQPAGTLITLQSGAGEAVVAYAPQKEFRSLLVCSPLLEEGGAYSVSAGATPQGEAQGGYYPDGAASDGTALFTFTVSGAVTNAVQDGAVQGSVFGGQDGNLPQMPEGEAPGMPNGEAPAMPEGETQTPGGFGQPQ